QKRKFGFAIFSKMVEIEFALQLIEDLITGVNVKILAPVRTAGNKSDEVRILPDDSALAPVATIFIDPLLKIETLEGRKHSTSVRGDCIAIPSMVREPHHERDCLTVRSP